MTAPYTTPLTAEERATINAAAEILLAHTAPDASWSLSGNHWHGSASITSFTYFTSQKTQHTWCKGETVADKVDWALVQEADECLDQEAVRQRRVDALKAELAKLERAA